jgi:hypothetical protein
MPLGEIFKTANDRLKSPFLSSFIFSWVAFNWKAIFVAFAGDENVHTKINCIESDYIDPYSAFLYPLLVALFYTLVFPFITVFFQWVTEKARVLASPLKNNRKILEAKGLEELAREEFKIEQARTGTEDLKELNDQIGTLNEDLKKEASKNTLLNDKITDFKKNQTQLEKTIKESQKELDTTNAKFAKWFEIDKAGNSALKDFYGIIDDSQLNNFKGILSILNSGEYPFSRLEPLEISVKEIEYFFNKGVIKFKNGINITNIMKEDIKSNKIVAKTKNNLSERIELTEKGIKLYEVTKYYVDLNDMPF